MNYRILGRTGLRISEIGFGAWAIGGQMWGEFNDIFSLRSLRMALDHGVNFFDTAFAYGRGHSEQLISKIYHESKGKDFIIADKIPPKDYTWPPRSDARISDIFPNDWIRSQTEKSLKNLKTECIDVHQLHVWNENWIQEDHDWFEEMKKLQKEGKIRYIGVSLNAHTPNDGLSLVASGMVDVIQVMYNIFDAAPMDALLPLCEKHRVGVIVRVPLFEGALTGKFNLDSKFHDNDFRSRYFSGEFFKRLIQRVDDLKPIAHKSNMSLHELALHFSLYPKEVSTVIVGMRNIEQVRSNCIVSDQACPSLDILEELSTHRWNLK